MNRQDLKCERAAWLWLCRGANVVEGITDGVLGIAVLSSLTLSVALFVQKSRYTGHEHGAREGSLGHGKYVAVDERRSNQGIEANSKSDKLYLNTSNKDGKNKE